MRVVPIIALFKQAGFVRYAINVGAQKYRSFLNNGAASLLKRAGGVWIGEFGTKCQVQNYSQRRSLILQDSFLSQKLAEGTELFHFGLPIKLKRRQRKPKAKQKAVPKPESELLFALPDEPDPAPEFRPLTYPIWTENKANLVKHYLFLFVQITKHGTYIDGFAGPQEKDEPSMWAAKLVLEISPPLLRNFYLFEKAKKPLQTLRALADSQPTVPNRIIKVYPGDFNAEVCRLLDQQAIKQTEACFCLLDQRTFECKWATVRLLAQYKKAGYKIELFYFLPIRWFDRALSGIKNEQEIKDWWGRDDWEQLKQMTSDERRDVLVHPFKNELTYTYVFPWPIRMKKDEGPVMYYMIHATDHPEAPKLMNRAYELAIEPQQRAEQLPLELGIS